MQPPQQSYFPIKRFLQNVQLTFTESMLIVLSSTLLFVFSLPHSIAFRKLLLVVGFAFAIKHCLFAMNQNRKISLFILSFLIFQLWILIITGFLAPSSLASFMEWKGQWLPVFMDSVLGIGVAKILVKSKVKESGTMVLLIVLIPIISFIFVNSLVIGHNLFLAGKFLPDQWGISEEKFTIGYLVSLFFPILIADLASRIMKGKRILPVNGWVISAILVLTVFSLFAASNRSGLVLIAFAFILGAGLLIPEFCKFYSVRKLAIIILTLGFFIAALGYASYKVDSRWQNFFETVKIGWNIDHDLLWLNGDGSDVPLTSTGKPVDVSTYYRIAWAHEGWRVLVAQPWGHGMARDVFRQVELKKYGHTSILHSHNSWIDLGLQVGVLGLLLWAGILFFLARTGWQAWRVSKEPIGLALTMLVILFTVNGLFDSIFRDHMVEQFMLVASLLFGKLCIDRSVK